MVGKVFPEMDAGGELNRCLDKWVGQHGLPPEVVPIPYGLPCSPEELDADQYMTATAGSEGKGGFAAPALETKAGAWRWPDRLLSLRVELRLLSQRLRRARLPAARLPGQSHLDLHAPS